MNEDEGMGKLMMWDRSMPKGSSPTVVPTPTLLVAAMCAQPIFGRFEAEGLVLPGSPFTVNHFSEYVVRI
jgi:hypothetical protein